MHELGVVFHCIKEVNKIAEENGVKKINSVTVEIGEVSTVLPYLFEDCWNWAVKKETVLKDAKIIVIAAGANQNPGETRMDLIYKNAKIFKEIINSVMKSGFDGYFLIATNPLDIMTYLTFKYSGFAPNKVIGTGTSLDTARLRFLISEKVGVNPKDINAYVIGEHGDSEFTLWSSALVGSEKIDKYLTEEEKESIENDVKNAAYEIINKKGATYYGVAMCLTRITNAILNNENSIITVSSYDKENDVFFGVPTIVNKDGASKKMYIELDRKETQKLINSIFALKKAIKKVENS